MSLAAFMLIFWGLQLMVFIYVYVGAEDQDRWGRHGFFEKLRLYPGSEGAIPMTLIGITMIAIGFGYYSSRISFRVHGRRERVALEIGQAIPGKLPIFLRAKKKSREPEL
jgi:hypothetical protein